MLVLDAPVLPMHRVRVREEIQRHDRRQAWQQRIDPSSSLHEDPIPPGAQLLLRKRDTERLAQRAEVTAIVELTALVRMERRIEEKASPDPLVCAPRRTRPERERALKVDVNQYVAEVEQQRIHLELASHREIAPRPCRGQALYPAFAAASN